MKKRIISLMAALCLALGLSALPAGADGPGEVDISSLTRSQAEMLLDKLQAYAVQGPDPRFAAEAVAAIRSTSVHALVYWTDDNTPALFLAKGYNKTENGGTQRDENTVVYDFGNAEVWIWRETGLELVRESGYGLALTAYPGYIGWGIGSGMESHWTDLYYSFADNDLFGEPFLTLIVNHDNPDGSSSYYVLDDSNVTGFENDPAVTEQEYIETRNAWASGAVASASYDADEKWAIWGVPTAEKTQAALEAAIAACDTRVAYPSNQMVQIDDWKERVEFPMCALRDEKGNETNYVRVRDLANWLSGTGAKFSVTWDGGVKLVRGEDYTGIPEDSEPGWINGPTPYTIPAVFTQVNGEPVWLEAVLITDQNGGGHTYYKLRALGEALGFNVGWSVQRGVFIETDKPYDPAN